MTKRTTLAALGALALAACGGGTGAHPTAPIGTADGAVREFVAAASDSNIARMSMAWGTVDGPAGVTGRPPSWEQRLKVMQYYLRGGTWRLVSNEADHASTTRRNVTMEFARGECLKVVPFAVVHSSHGGWLVESVDLNVVGNPMNPCPAPTPAAPNGNP